MNKKGKDDKDKCSFIDQFEPNITNENSDRWLNKTINIILPESLCLKFPSGSFADNNCVPLLFDWIGRNHSHLKHTLIVPPISLSFIYISLLAFAYYWHDREYLYKRDLTGWIEVGIVLTNRTGSWRVEEGEESTSIITEEEKEIERQIGRETRNA